jgi:hypothetical protein
MSGRELRGCQARYNPALRKLAEEERQAAQQSRHRPPPGNGSGGHPGARCLQYPITRIPCRGSSRRRLSYNASSSVVTIWKSRVLIGRPPLVCQ